MNIIDCGILYDIKKPNTPISVETINLFIKLVRERYGFDMIDLNSYPTFSQIQKYPPISGDKPDIQILYSNMFDTPHFVCVYYDPKYKTVYHYDSLITWMNHTTILYHKEIKANRYPMAEKVIVIPTTEQYDVTSSGLFVIAYTTSLILGDSPANVAYKMSAIYPDTSFYLREHIAEMLKINELSPFPQ